MYHMVEICKDEKREFDSRIIPRLEKIIQDKECDMRRLSPDPEFFW